MGKRGQKRQAVKREPNGRASRKKDDVVARILEQVDRDVRETLMTGLSARVRVHGVPPEQSRDQMAGSFIGRLCLQRVISRIQYDAALAWLEDMENHAAVIGAPRQPGAVDLNAAKGRNDHENVEYAARCMARYKAANKAVQDRQNELGPHAHLFGALDTLVRRDVPLEHLVGDLRTALNALARHYRLDGRRAA